MESNQAAPRALAALFHEWMWLLGEEAEQFVAQFGERAPEPTLAEYQAEIDKMTNAAHTIRHLCTDDVRTGERRTAGQWWHAPCVCTTICSPSC